MTAAHEHGRPPTTNTGAIGRGRCPPEETTGIAVGRGTEGLMMIAAAIGPRRRWAQGDRPRANGRQGDLLDRFVHGACPGPPVNGGRHADIIEDLLYRRAWTAK